MSGRSVRSSSVVGLSLISVLGLACAPAFAQAPDRLDHFRLVPRASIAHQTGGFAGVDILYRLRGDYDLVRGPGGPGTPDGGLNIGARFLNAEIWGSIISDLPVPAVVLDVDEVLNLEGLVGEGLPVGGPFDAFKFTGRTADESSVDLLGVVLGPWMFVRGGTTPPPGSADFFEYDVRWLARSRPWADRNEDGVVNAADYTALRDAGASAIELADWRDQYGELEPDVATFDAMADIAAAAFASGTGTAVPEPAAWLLAMLGCVALATRRR